jgi:peptidoglycan/LPS O-acetylase OafA/YrhL
MRTRLIAGFALLAVAVIFILQNAHSADISFLGVHLVLPLAAALLMAAAGPARVARPGRSSGAPLRKARALSSPRPISCRCTRPGR